MYEICYWDAESQSMKVRPATAAEITDIDARKAAAPVPVPTVPQSVPMLNAHLALIQSGQMELLNARLAELPELERLEASAYLSLAQMCRRDNKWVARFGIALGLNDAALDQLFILAGGLNP